MLTSEAPRSTNVLLDGMVRLAGIGGVIGGISLAAACLSHPTGAPPETVSSSPWMWVHAGFMVSLIAGAFFLVALLQRYFRADGRLSGFVGFAMAMISLMFVFGLDYSEALISPTLAVEFSPVI
ncbi:MAG: hypothetical protein R3282_00290 [Rhodothermales bacterium]|nr:hypothetical protein [Rhodothermales bacterium]